MGTAKVHRVSPTRAFEPTAEQRAILDAVKQDNRSLMIRAYAGAAKTTTLELIAKALPPSLPVLYLVFNAKNKKEAEERMPSQVTVMTMNGLGHRAFGRGIQRSLKLDDRKLGRIVTATAKATAQELDTEQWCSIRTLVTKAMQVGIVPNAANRPGLIPDTDENWESLREDATPDAQAVALARTVLWESIKEAFIGTISFDDQIYCSALLGGAFPRYPLVMVDEAQDQSRLNAIMIRRCAADRLIIVGDEKQAIYVWRGADGNSMTNLKALRTQWIELPLATTFRCAKIVVARNAAHAPGFTAWGTNPDGCFRTLPNENCTTWNWHHVSQSLRPESTCAILCRNNAPLLSLAFKLIRASIPVVMAGREIGKGLTALSRKIDKSDDTPIAEHTAHIISWRQKEISLALANDAESKAEGIADRADCLLAVAETATTSGDLRRRLDTLFSRETGKVTLSSIHRAKGLEWDCVVHLDPWRIPSKYAKGEAIAQEHNLKYVAETRAKHTLIEASLEDYSND
jgi:DNA helicase II / ATP-dependent DNA helicase PcrA